MAINNDYDLNPFMAILQSLKRDLKYTTKLGTEMPQNPVGNFGGTLLWGNMLGNIENQKDLMAKLKELHEEIQAAVIGEVSLDGLAKDVDLQELEGRVNTAIGLLQDAIDSNADLISQKADKSELADYAKKTDLTGLATEEYVDDKIFKIDIQDINLDGYAKLTDLADYVKTEDLPDNHLTAADIANKADKSDLDGLATEQYVDDAIADIDVDLTGYATEQWVEDKNYLTEHQSLDSKQDLITDLDEIREGAALGKTSIQEHQDISNLATKQEVLDGLSDKVDKETGKSLIADTEIERLKDIENYDDTDVKADIQDLKDATADIADIRDKANSALQEHQDISGKADITYVDEELAKKQDKGEYVEYKHFLDNPNRKAIQLDNHDVLSGIMTNGDGANLAMLSKWDVADFGSPKVHMNLNTLDTVTINDNKVVATTDDITSAITDANLDQYATRQELLDGLVDKQDKIDDLAVIRSKANSALQEHQSLADYYTKTEINNKLAAALTYKGSVDTFEELPTEDLHVGDVYNVAQAGTNNNAGDNVAWNGTEWDVLAGTVSLAAYAKTVDVNTLLEDKVDKQQGMSLIADTEIIRLAQVDNYDDTQIRQDLSDLSSQVDANKTSIEDTVQHMQDHMDAVDANAEAITTNLNTINQNMTRIDTLESLTETQGTAINNLDTRMTNHGISFNTWKESVDNILPDVATNKSDIDSLKSRVGINETAIDDLKDEVGANKSQIEANVTTLQGLVDGLTARESFVGYYLHTTTIQAIEGFAGAYAHNAETGTKWVWNVTNEAWQDSGVVIEDQEIDKSDIVPLMDGEAAIGASNKYAAADHIHPTDTTRASQYDFNQHATSTLNPHNVTKEQVGLDQVDNTTDLNKPISLATQAALDGKVDAVEDKELSSNDFTDELKAKLEAIESQATKNIIDVAIDANSENAVQNKAIKAALDLKVDVVENKGLSSNDYTDEEKTKLAGLENYELQEATDTALGGFKTGGSFSLDVDGTLLFTGEALGAKGDSAYKVATDNGFVGTEYEWIQSLKGDSAYQVAVNKGFTGTEEEWLEYISGPEGKSTYQVWLDNDNEGTVDDFLTAMKGPQGKSAYDLWKDAGNVGTMEDYLAAIKGVDGQSAYELSGFLGTEEEWIESLQGVSGQSAYELSGFAGTQEEWIASLQGTNGKSAYELWIEAGNSGTKADFLAAIKGQDGEDGVNPTATVTNLTNGAKITLTDHNGTTEAEVHDGVGIASIAKTGTTGNVDTYTITYTNNDSTTFEVANGSGNEITKVSDLENDSEFITNIVDNLLNYYKKNEVYTKAEVESMISTVSALNLEIVSSLNAVLAGGVSTSTIYLVETSEGSGVYTQYLWMADTSEWATLGTTSVDLSNYYNKSEIDGKLSIYVSTNSLISILADYATNSSLKTVARTGNYNDLTNLPTIPSIDGLATETYVDTAVNGLANTAATTYRKVADKVPYTDISGTPALATVATSGSYNDLTNKPTIPEVTVDATLNNTSENPIQNKAVHAALALKQDKMTIDTTLSATSTNPVQNKAVQAALANKQDKMTVDTALSDSSTNPVQNKIIKAALDGKQNTMTIDTALSSTSTNPVQNKVINTALANKQDKLTIDTALSATSTNPVQNKVINTALALKQDKLTIDTGLSSTSTNVVTNKAIYDKFTQIEQRINFLQTALQNMQIGGISSDKGVLISSENTLTSDFVVNYSRSFKVEVDFMVTVPNTRYILCGDYLSGRGDNSRLNLEVFSDNKYRIYMDNSHMVDIRIPDPLIEVDTRYNIVYNWNASTRTATSSVNGVEVYNQSWSANEVPTGAADRPMKIGSDHRSSFLTSLTIYKCKFSLL